MTSQSDAFDASVVPAGETAAQTDMDALYAPSGVARETFVKARHGRNVAIALSLIGFAVLLFAVTLVKLGPGAVARPF